MYESRSAIASLFSVHPLCYEKDLFGFAGVGYPAAGNREFRARIGLRQLISVLLVGLAGVWLGIRGPGTSITKATVLTVTGLYLVGRLVSRRERLKEEPGLRAATSAAEIAASETDLNPTLSLPESWKLPKAKKSSGKEWTPEPPLGKPTWAVLGLVALVLCIGAAIRIPKLGDVPAGLFCDEADLGYNAFCIAKTGKDQYGTSFPLFVPSFGVAFKNPAFIYAAAVPIGMFGLSEFSLRLTSAVYGLIAIFGVYLVGSALYSRSVGLVAGLLLALSPWHIQFSRLAFELISLPAFFLLGLGCLMHGLRSGRKLQFVGAGLFFGLTPYTYAVANVFVPLMMLAVLFLFPRHLWRCRWKVVLGFAVLLLVLSPFLYFQFYNPQSMHRFSLIGIIQPGKPWQQIWAEFVSNYNQYMSFHFLFRDGDPIVRHSVRGFGENLLSIAPWVGLGLLTCLLRFRQGLLLWCWLLCYPIAAALVAETPSATRSIVGAPLFPLLAAIGIVSIFQLLAHLPRWLGKTVSVAFALLLVFSIGREFQRYLTAYFVEYPKYSAPTYGGFQYGYRDSIHFMEQERKNYDLLVLTATEVNQPGIFPLFYSSHDPVDFQKRKQIDYDIFVPEEYGRYNLERQKILYQVHPQDLQIFEEYKDLKTILGPDGQVAYKIIQPLKRRKFIDNWFISEPLQANLTDIPKEQRNPDAVQRWRPIRGQFVYADLNRAYGNNPENMCVVAATRLQVQGDAKDAFLECVGSEDRFQAYLNGELAGIANLAKLIPSRFPLKLKPGANELQALSCETVGDWHFACSVVDAKGKSLPNVTSTDPRVRLEVQPPSEEPTPVRIQPDSLSPPTQPSPEATPSITETSTPIQANPAQTPSPISSEPVQEPTPIQPVQDPSLQTPQPATQPDPSPSQGPDPANVQPDAALTPTQGQATPELLPSTSSTAMPSQGSLPTVTPIPAQPALEPHPTAVQPVEVQPQIQQATPEIPPSATEPGPPIPAQPALEPSPTAVQAAEVQPQNQDTPEISPSSAETEDSATPEPSQANDRKSDQPESLNPTQPGDLGSEAGVTSLEATPTVQAPTSPVAPQASEATPDSVSPGADPNQASTTSTEAPAEPTPAPPEASPSRPKG